MSFTYVRSGIAGGSSLTSESVTLNGVSAGDLVVLGVVFYNSGGLPATTIAGVSDTGGNSWKIIRSQNDGSNIRWCQLFYSVITTGGNLTFSVTPGGSDYITLAVAEYSFTGGNAIAVDGLGSSYTAGTSSTYSTGTFGSVSGDLVVALGEAGGGSAVVSAGSGYSMRAVIAGSSTVIAAGIEDGTASGATVNPVIDSSGETGAGIVIGAAFRAFTQPTSGFTFIQSTGTAGPNQSATSLTCPLIIQAAGDLIVVEAAWFVGSSIETAIGQISDTLGNTWYHSSALWNTHAFGSTYASLDFFFCVANAAGATTITWTPFVHGYLNLAVQEYGGITSGFVPIPDLTIYTNGGATSFTLPENGLVGPNAGDLVIAAAATSTGTSPASLSAASGYNQRFNNLYTSGTTQGFLVEDLLATTTSVSPTIATTSATAQNYIMAAVSFTLAPTVPTPPSGTASLWLEADSGAYSNTGSTLATLGVAVEQWNDKSGNGYNAGNTGTSTTRPVWWPGIGPNGGPALAFTSSSSQFLNNAYTGEVGTIFVVYMPAAINTDMALLGADTTDSVNIPAYNLQPCSNSSDTDTINPAWSPMLFTRATDLDTTTSETLQCETLPVCNVWDIVVTRLDPTAQESRLYRNGVLLATQTASSTVRPINTSNVTMGCGWASHAKTNYYNGWLAAVVICNTDLTDAQVAGWLAYLQAKYQLAPAIPSFSYADYGLWFQNPVKIPVGGGSSGNYYAGAQSPYIVWSLDGFNFQTIPCSIALRSAEAFRDPRVIFYNGMFWCCYTTDAGPNGFGVAASLNGINYWHVTNVASGSGAVNESPKWFIDPANNSIHVLLTIGNAGYEFHPTNSAMTTWSSGTSLGYTPPNGDAWYDMSLIYVSGTYYMLYTNTGSGGTAYFLELASASALLGPWTNVESGSSWLGVTLVEGANIVNTGGSNFSIYFDGAPGYSGGAGYWVMYSTAGITGPYTTPAAINLPFLNGGKCQNGGFIVASGIQPGNAYQCDGAGGSAHYAY